MIARVFLFTLIGNSSKGYSKPRMSYYYQLDLNKPEILKILEADMFPSDIFISSANPELRPMTGQMDMKTVQYGMDKLLSRVKKHKNDNEHPITYIILIGLIVTIILLVFSFFGDLARIICFIPFVVSGILRDIAASLRGYIITRDVIKIIDFLNEESEIQGREWVALIPEVRLLNVKGSYTKKTIIVSLSRARLGWTYSPTVWYFALRLTDTTV